MNNNKDSNFFSRHPLENRKCKKQDAVILQDAKSVITHCQRGHINRDACKSHDGETCRAAVGGGGDGRCWQVFRLPLGFFLLCRWWRVQWWSYVWCHIGELHISSTDLHWLETASAAMRCHKCSLRDAHITVLWDSKEVATLPRSRRQPPGGCEREPLIQSRVTDLIFTMCNRIMWGWETQRHVQLNQAKKRRWSRSGHKNEELNEAEQLTGTPPRSRTGRFGARK